MGIDNITSKFCTTIKVSASNSNPQQTTIGIISNSLKENEDENQPIEKTGRKLSYSSQESGALYFKYNKRTHSVVNCQCLSCDVFPVTAITNNTSGIHNNTDYIVVIASAGNVGGVLHHVQNSLRAIESVATDVIESMTTDSAFVFALNCETGDFFFETKPLQCKLQFQYDNLSGFFSRKVDSHTLKDLEQYTRNEMQRVEKRVTTALQAQISETIFPMQTQLDTVFGNFQEICVRGSNSGALKNSNQWQTYPELTITFTLSQSGICIFYYNITSECHDSSHLCTTLYLDGEEKSEGRCITGNYQYHSNIVSVPCRLSAGTHKVEVKYRTPGWFPYSGGVSDWDCAVLKVFHSE